MKVCGIIAEYNPLHNGHLYHLQESKRITGADYTIVIMSGNFVQRGTPAIIDKYTRAGMALACGADLVIELPSCYATASAEYFAAGAVSLLDKLGVVTHLCFGSECGEITPLLEIATITATESPIYQQCLKDNLKKGLSFPAARAAAILSTEPDIAASTDLQNVLNSPNNILGIEYIKSILTQHSDIIPVTMKRIGADYHDTDLGTAFSSATALRLALEKDDDITQLYTYIPEATRSILGDYLSDNQPLHPNDFSELLHYKLLSEADQGFTSYMDVSTELSDRIRKHIYAFSDFEGFCNLLKTKELTYTRISRCLLHILLNIKKEELAHYRNEQSLTPYARVLGFRKDATPLLHLISTQTSIPLVTKLADAYHVLNEDAYAMLCKEITINNIYNSVRALKSGKPMVNEYSTPIVIV